MRGKTKVYLKGENMDGEILSEAFARLLQLYVAITRPRFCVGLVVSDKKAEG